jgi:hypothetical protein
MLLDSIGAFIIKSHVDLSKTLALLSNTPIKLDPIRVSLDSIGAFIIKSHVDLSKTLALLSNTPIKLDPIRVLLDSIGAFITTAPIENVNVPAIPPTRQPSARSPPVHPAPHATQTGLPSGLTLPAQRSPRAYSRKVKFARRQSRPQFSRISLRWPPSAAR